MEGLWEEHVEKQMHGLSCGAETGASTQGGEEASHYPPFYFYLANRVHILRMQKPNTQNLQIRLFLVHTFATCFMPDTVLGYHHRFVNLAPGVVFSLGIGPGCDRVSDLINLNNKVAKVTRDVVMGKTSACSCFTLSEF